jgi:SAM-dependent methyltransferase
VSEPTTNDQPPTTKQQRLAFDAVPEIYDRVRPSFPDALFVELFSYIGLPSREIHAVEFGPGTGQATQHLLQRGVSVTAVEIGPHLAAFLGNKFASFGDQLDVINTSFEDYDPADARFDLVLSANAWHWFDPSIRLSKIHELLKPNGSLALLNNNQITSDADRGYFDRVFPIYKRYRPDEKEIEAPGEDVVPPEFDELSSSGLVSDVELHRYRWDQTYSAKVYTDLLRSHSPSQMMESSAREALIADLRQVIEEEYGGTVTVPIVATLTLGRRRTELA